MARILYVILGETMGGITTGLQGLLKHLSPKQWEATVAVLNRGPVLRLLEQHGVATIFVPRKNRLGLLQRLIQSRRLQLVQSCDAAMDGALAAHRMQIPHIWFLGGSVGATFGGASEKALQLFRTLMTRISDVVIVPSQMLARTQFPHLSPRKLRVIPWGVENPAPVPARIRNRLRHRLGIRPSESLIAMIGNFYPAKRHFDFLRVAAFIHRTHPSTRFLIAGRCVGTDSQSHEKSLLYQKKVAQTIWKQRLHGIVKITSFSPNNRCAWLRNIDLLLVPSEEGISQAMLEAMACGVPVIASDIGGNPEVIQHKVSGWLVPYQNPKAMAKAALGILQNPTLAKRLGQRGQRRVFSAFSAAQQAKRFQHLYEILLTRKPSPRSAA